MKCFGENAMCYYCGGMCAWTDDNPCDNPDFGTAFLTKDVADRMYHLRLVGETLKRDMVCNASSESIAREIIGNGVEEYLINDDYKELVGCLEIVFKANVDVLATKVAAIADRTEGNPKIIIDSIVDLLILFWQQTR